MTAQPETGYAKSGDVSIEAFVTPPVTIPGRSRGTKELT
jgi:hypothetical protein